MSDQICRKSLPYNTQLELRKRIQKEWPIFKKINEIGNTKWSKPTIKGKIQKDPFTVYVRNFYLNNSICRSSETMKLCANSFTNKNELQEAAE